MKNIPVVEGSFNYEESHKVMPKRLSALGALGESSEIIMGLQSAPASLIQKLPSVSITPLINQLARSSDIFACRNISLCNAASGIVFCASAPAAGSARNIEMV